MKGVSETISRCRACGAGVLSPILTLGEMPLVNTLLRTPDEHVPYVCLDLVRCPACNLVQITETVDAELLFRDYTYFSSYSDTFVEHARAYAQRMIERLDLGHDSFVVEAASNDGYLLQFFVEAGIPVLGVEPARNVAAVAERRGVDTVAEFLDSELAEAIVADRGTADLVIANNVIAHVADLHGFLVALHILAGETGLVSIEVPYLVDMFEGLAFDTIYHEHLCYFSLSSIDCLLAQHELAIVDVERIPVHGGSIRISATARADIGSSSAVDSMLAAEAQWGIATPVPYARFADGVQELTGAIRNFVAERVRRGESVAGYGAAAKGAVLLNACGLDQSFIEFVVDRNPVKQGRFLPGVRIPIRPPEALLESQPDAVLVLVWNILGEVLLQQEGYRQRGGRFIVPIPEPSFV